MKKAEKILVCLAVIGIILRFLLINYSGLLMVISFTLLSILYFPLGFLLFNDIRLRDIFKRQSYRGVSRLKLIGTVGVGISLVSVILGICFRILGYEGSYLLLKEGLFLTLISFVIALIRYLKKESISYKNILIRICIIGFIGFLAIITPRYYLQKILHRNSPDYLEQMEEQ
jgi:hypothetical protein